MNRFYRICIIVVAFVLLASFLTGMTASASAEDELDLYYPTDTEDHWAYAELDNFINADFLKGYKDDKGVVTVKPNKAITRAEFVALLVRVLGLTSNGSGKDYADVDQAKWYAEAIRIASAHGIVNGISETKFAPERLVNRGEIATMIVRAFDQSLPYVYEAGDFKDVPNYFAKPYIEKAGQAGIIAGVTEELFKPYAPAKRAEAVAMLDRALYATPGGNNDLPELFQVLQNDETKQFEAYANKNYAGLDEIYNTYYTGYYLAYNRYMTEGFRETISEGYDVDIKLISPQSFSVLDYSDRVAIVEATGGEHSVTTTFEGETDVETITTDGVYYLKRMMDNSWKVYAYFESE
jgi:hypothetical protein